MATISPINSVSINGRLASEYSLAHATTPSSARLGLVSRLTHRQEGMQVHISHRTRPCGLKAICQLPCSAAPSSFRPARTFFLARRSATTPRLLLPSTGRTSHNPGWLYPTLAPTSRSSLIATLPPRRSQPFPTTARRAMRARLLDTLAGRLQAKTRTILSHPLA